MYLLFPSGVAFKSDVQNCDVLSKLELERNTHCGVKSGILYRYGVCAHVSLNKNWREGAILVHNIFVLILLPW